MDSIVYKNVLAWRGCEKLYLDTQSKDVFFIFRSENNDEIEKIPAHKCILSATSPVFRALFYGPHKQDGEIEIVDATSDAFKEFLKFFYRSQVKLTTEMLPDVLILCKRYQLDDWQTVLHACGDISKSSLTLDKLCWGYELAILSELEELKSFCEEEIGKNAVEVFCSSSFLKCQPNLLRHIMQLDTLNCSETEVFDGCMAWAKAECLRKGYDENDAKNLRTQLGDLFHGIRFGEMTHEDFQHRYRVYDGLLSVEEFRDITMMITDKRNQADHFNPCLRRLRHKSIERNQIETTHEMICKREEIFEKKSLKDFYIETSALETTFTSNSQLLLKQLKIYQFHSNVRMTIYESPTKKNCGILVAFESINSGCDVTLSTPILIKPNIRYSIEFSVPRDRYCVNRRLVKTVKLKDGTLIDFGDENPYITRLHFIKSEKI